MTILSKSTSVVISVAIFLVVDRAFDVTEINFEWDEPLTSQVVHTLAQPTIISMLSVGLILKAFLLLYSNAEMLQAFNSQDRSMKFILRRIPLARWVEFALYVIIWNLSFLLIGLACSFVADAEIALPWLRTSALILLGALLFPLYYVGISLGAILCALQTFGNLKILVGCRRAFSRLAPLYGFYALRSLADLGGGLIIPVLVASFIPFKWLGLSVTIALSTAYFTFFRLIAVSFKLEILRLITRTKDTGQDR